MPKAKQNKDVLRKARVLRVKNPKGKTKGKNMKDGKVFNPKGKREKPSSKKNLICKAMPPAGKVVCWDKGKKKRHDKKKVKRKK